MFNLVSHVLKNSWVVFFLIYNVCELFPKLFLDMNFYLLGSPKQICLLFQFLLSYWKYSDACTCLEEILLSASLNAQKRQVPEP